MDEAYSSAERIRADVGKLKGKNTLVRASDKCCMCNNHLMTQHFHLFPICGHKFHTKCLVQAVKPHLSLVRQKRLAELQDELALKPTSDDLQSVDSKTLRMSRMDYLRVEMETMIASECIHCGEVKIKLIDQPFIEDSEFESLNKEWL